MSNQVRSIAIGGNSIGFSAGGSQIGSSNLRYLPIYRKGLALFVGGGN